MRRTFCLACVGILFAFPASLTHARDETDLRLVPFPKEIQLEEGSFDLRRGLILEAPEEDADFLASILTAELKRAGLPQPETRAWPRKTFRLRPGDAGEPNAAALEIDKQLGSESYALDVQRNAVICEAAGRPGLFYGLQTLCQLVRANRQDDAIPCLSVKDWPSLRWRCFQDDMTRGPSSKPETLKSAVALGASLKMNLFTYYMEYQYAFKKHPLIGPEDGSLTPETLGELVDYGAPFHVDILGNQQSFGHFARILQHEEYAHLRETPTLLCPVREGAYALLDDMYSEVCPLLPFPFFNVCCDETWGLGTGPSKELADEIGTGGVYVGHVRKIHDLLKEKYQKRMMMWGDIILQHPDQLDKIPKDTIMLTWGYGNRDSFEGQIIPFADSGYEFFVCPGVSNWNRILPDFGVATTNIHHFVRDGAKHGAIGMLNTAWEDDGEALNAPKWHAYAWGAECAWNASTTDPEQFNRRIGAVLFGEPGDHFGRAIELLAETHRLPGMQGMNNRRFWQDDFPPRMKPQTARSTARQLLEIVRPAIEHLEACDSQATGNTELLDPLVFGARRMEHIGQRMLDGLEAADRYCEAYESPQENAQTLLPQVEALVRKNRDAYEDFSRQFQRLWLLESKPYALQWTTDRYDAAIARYEDLAQRLAKARELAAAGESIPSPGELGLAFPDGYSRRTRPHRVEPEPLKPDSPWVEPNATHRFGLVVNAGPSDRFDLPIELDIRLPDDAAAGRMRVFHLDSAGTPRELLGQLDPSPNQSRTRLTAVFAGQLEKETDALLHVYLGLPDVGPAREGAARTSEAEDGAHWIENDKVRLLVGPEGGHVYRWEVKSLGNRDLTMPGQTSWSGFSDMAQEHRSAPHELRVTASGPALVRCVCTDPLGLQKTISLFGDARWIEVDLNHATQHYWDFDNPSNFSADGPSPGTYLFSNGTTGPVGRQSDGVPAQVKAANVFWGIKWNPDKLALGIVTPEVAAFHHIAPGAGAGGVGIERSPHAGHFVTFAGELEAEPHETMQRLRQTLDYRHPPEITLFGLQERK